MGLKGCEIKLDNPWNTYYAGQTVNGQVVFTFDSPKKIRGIIIRFMGEANTSWDVTVKEKNEQGQDVDRTETLTGHEEYFQTQYYLLGGKNSKEIELPQGTHTYTFTCALPPTLPSSFEGEWGHVRYTIKVTLDRPWKFDQDAKMAFTVISPVDLNENPRVKEPGKLELEKSFCCLCCKSGPLSAIVSIPVTGFVSGQTIPIVAECDNASNVKVNQLKCMFRKTVIFRTSTPRREVKKDKVTIAEIAVGPVEAHGSNTWRQQLDIPPLPPSNLVNCSLIDMDYDLKVELEVSGAHRNLAGNIPIVLGTVPLSSFQPPAPGITVPIQDPSLAPTQPVSPVTDPNAGGALGWNMNNTTNGSPYPNIPPPAFVESAYRAQLTDGTDSEHVRLIGANDFAPRYPTFEYPNAMSNKN